MVYLLTHRKLAHTEVLLIRLVAETVGIEHTARSIAYKGQPIDREQGLHDAIFLIQLLLFQVLQARLCDMNLFTEQQI